MSKLSTPHRRLLAVLLLVNAMVLLGQLWPEGAPPFARLVNVGFLVASAGYFAGRLAGRV